MLLDRVFEHERDAKSGERGADRLVDAVDGDLTLDADLQLAAIASAKGITPAQIALAWVLVQKPWIVPTPGTTKQHRLDENIGAADVKLDAEDLRKIADALANVTVVGDRYPAHLASRAGK